MQAKLKLKRDKKGKIEKGFLTGVIFYYTRLMKPVPIFEQRNDPSPTLTEYCIDLVVTEEVADEWDEVFVKQSSKKYSKEKFMQAFKVENEADLPDPKANKFYVIKLKQPAQNKSGKPIAKSTRPRVVETVEGKPVDITFEKLIGNGSKGDVMVRVLENDYGAFSYLARVLVKDLIEFHTDDFVDEDEEEFLGGALELADYDDCEQNEDDSSEVDEDDSSEVDEEEFEY